MYGGKGDGGECEDGAKVSYMELFKELSRLPVNEVNMQELRRQQEEQKMKEEAKLRKRPQLRPGNRANEHQCVWVLESRSA